MNIIAKTSMTLLALYTFGAYSASEAAVIKPILQNTQQTGIIQAKSHFNFSLNVGPQFPSYPVFNPYPVYQPYYAPVYPVYREYYSYPSPMYEAPICYDNWGNPHDCYVDYYY